MGINPSQLGQSPKLPQNLSYTTAIAAIGSNTKAAAANKRSLDTQILNTSRYLTSPYPSLTIPKYQKPH